MKKSIFNNLLLVVGLSFAFTSCLKDEGYDNGTYGAVRNTEGKEFVTIPVAAKNPNSLGLESKSGAQNIDLFAASYDYVNPAPEDITATVTLNNDLVTKADPTVTILPASTYTLPSNSITIPKGSRVSGQFVLSLNTSTK